MSESIVTLVEAERAEVLGQMRELIDAADREDARPLTDYEHKRYEYFHLWLEYLSSLRALLEAA